MNSNLLRLIISILTIGLFCDVATAQSYNLDEYFFLSQGNSFAYGKAGAEPPSIKGQAVFGSETIGMVPTEKMWHWGSNNPLVTGYNALVWDPLLGLSRHKAMQLQGIEIAGHTMYDPADVLLPKSINVGETFRTSTSYTRFDASGSEVATGTLERELTLTGVEEVTVRAGTFTDCPKFSETGSWEEGQNRSGRWERTFWLAPGVGMVKWVEPASEFISEESSWGLLLGYINQELILPPSP